MSDEPGHDTAAHVTGSGPDSLRSYALLSLLATAGFFYVNIMAAIVDGLVTGLGFTTVQAGYVASANVYGASVGSFCAVFLVRRIPWRPTLLGLFLVLIGFDLASAFVREPAALVTLRALHGVVGGLSVGITYSVMARVAAPDRAFGMLLLLQYGLGGLGVMFLPALVPVYGAAILFFTLAALTTCALIATLALGPLGFAEAAVAGPRLAEQKLPWGLTAITLISLFLFQAGNMALGAFLIGLGEQAGLSRPFVSQALGWSTWLGMLGAVAVVAVGLRYGRWRPLVLAFALTLLSNTAFAWSEFGLVYFAANVVASITWAFVVPYLFGMASRLDPSGGLATLAGFASKLGLASGPLVGGMLVGQGYPVLIGASVLVLAGSAVSSLAAAQSLDRKSTLNA